jgi:DNA-binding PadR family transcriptional regulator
MTENDERRVRWARRGGVDMRDEFHPGFRGRRGPFGPGFGPPGFGGGFGPGEGRRQRGDIRTALLALLAEEAGHGYDLISRLDERSGGEWRPSPGSVYPTLQMLEDEGFARSTENEGKRVYEITDEGRVEAERRIEAAGGPPWERRGRGAAAGVGELREAVGQLGFAAKQVAASGRDDQVEAAAVIVNDARKAIYRLLADD